MKFFYLSDEMYKLYFEILKGCEFIHVNFVVLYILFNVCSLKKFNKHKINSQ